MFKAMSITKYGNWSVAFRRKSALKTAVLIRPGTGSTADAAGSRQKASGTQNKLFSAAIWCWTDSFITQRPTTSTTFHDNIAVTMTRRLTSNHVTTMFVDCAALFGTNLFYERTFCDKVFRGSSHAAATAAAIRNENGHTNCVISSPTRITIY